MKSISQTSVGILGFQCISNIEYLNITNLTLTQLSEYILEADNDEYSLNGRNMRHVSEIGDTNTYKQRKRYEVLEVHTIVKILLQ